MTASLAEQDEFLDCRFVEQNFVRQAVTAVTFTNCLFKACNFSETQFQRCRFRDCQFFDCDLSLISVDGCTFQHTKFRDSKLIGVNWSKAARLQLIEFHDCQISYSTFMGLDLERAAITGCLAKEVHFSETNLTLANCTHTDFSDSRFFHTDLTQADFTGASNYFIASDLNTLKKTKFSMPEALSLLYGLDIILDDTNFQEGE